MTVDDVKMEVEHERGPLEFRLRVFVTITHALLGEMPEPEKLPALLEPLVRARFAQELEKETRPFTWRFTPVLAVTGSFDTDVQIVEMLGRGQYRDGQ